MNYQKKDTSVTQEECFFALSNKYPELRDWPTGIPGEYYAFPYTFGSTGGPFGGVGGQMMTTFTIEAWVCYNYAVLFCGERLIKVTDKWEGPQTVRI